MVVSVFDIPVMMFIFGFSIAIFVHIIRTWNNENKDKYKKINEIMNGILCTALGIYYPFYVLKFGANIPSGGILQLNASIELSIIGLVGIVGAMLAMFTWSISHKIQTIRHPELLKEVNNYEFFCEKFRREYKMVISRKITHLLPLGVVAGLIIIFYLLSFSPIFADKWRNYALFFIVIIGADFALTFAIGDLIRLFDYSYMPAVVGEMFATGLTPDELDSFASTSIMVFGFAPFLLFEFPLFFIIMLITSVADGMASIFGIYATKKNVKHNFPKGSDKSIEGYIGGSLFTFLSVLLGGMFSNAFGFSSWAVWTIGHLTVLGIILAVVVFVIDIITSTKLDLCDNYMNPLICGFVAMLYLALVGIPF